MKQELRPNGEQFAEGSASDQAFAVGSSVDLAGNLRAMVQQARAEWTGQFDAAWWLRKKLKVTFFEAEARTVSEETQELMRDVMSAYDILAYEHYIYDDYRRSAGISLAVYAAQGVTLEDPHGRQLLEAMAEATDIPFTPGQTRFELPGEVIKSQGL